MTKQERANYVGKELAKLYPETPVPLDHTDAFTLLVAVVLSAQCTDKKVNEITPALFAEAGTPAKMAEMTEARVLTLIRQLGLAPQKSRALVGLGKMLMAKHGGVVPRTFEELEELPGVGHKTGAGLRRPGLPRRHAYPPSGQALETQPREICRAGREGPQTALPGGQLEPAAPAHHLLRPRALHGERV